MSGDHSWFAHYPAGVPQQISPDHSPTVVHIFEQALANYGARPALESFGKQMTFAELGAAAHQIAAGLQGMNLQRGDRIAIMMPNVMVYEPVLFGILLSGFVVVNVNPQYTARELVHQLNDSGAKILFVLENFAHTVEKALPELKTLEQTIVCRPGDFLGLKGKIINFVSAYVKRAVPAFHLQKSQSFADFFAQARNRQFRPAGVQPDDVAFLQYTGGTTGISKGATLLHRNIAANVAQSAAWLEPQIGQRDDHVMLTALPLYHVLALTACCLFMVRIGAKQVLVANPRDLPGLVKVLSSQRFTLIVLVNTLYNLLCDQPGIEQVDFSQVKACVAGGMATQTSVAERWKKVSGKPIIEGYGLSETSPVASVNRLDIVECTGTIGYPVPSTILSIRDQEGNQVAQGEPGEICIFGPQVMAGYWQRPDETALVMTSDGFFRSGDVGIALPDGTFRIVDRLKDMISVSGLKVFPNEVEDVLALHPQVMEAAVIGRADAHSGEAVYAYVVLRDQGLEPDELRKFCKERLAPYKVPKIIEFRALLPKTNVGKILRRALRDEDQTQA